MEKPNKLSREDREAVLADICARIPYGVKVRVFGDWFYDEREPYDAHLSVTDWKILSDFAAGTIDLKPYLRPMADMTEEEDNEWRGSFLDNLFRTSEAAYPESESRLAMSHGDSTNWLNRNGFDHRGLIPRGLAFETMTTDKNQKK
jgi:hypothetical protein